MNQRQHWDWVQIAGYASLLLAMGALIVIGVSLSSLSLERI
jgi:hypothetical protein